MRTVEIEKVFAALLVGCGAPVDAAAAADEAAAEYPVVTVESSAGRGAGFGDSPVRSADVSVSLAAYRDDDPGGTEFAALCVELENRLFSSGLVGRLNVAAEGKIHFFGASEIESFDASDTDVRGVVWQLRVFYSPLA